VEALGKFRSREIDAVSKSEGYIMIFSRGFGGAVKTGLVRSAVFVLHTTTLHFLKKCHVYS
jgi:hypothetical protein